MVITLRRRADLTLESYREVAWEGRPVQIDPAALADIARAREAFMAFLDSDPDRVIYGVTTGYGQMARIRLDPEERKSQARRPAYATMTAFGESLPERVKRGIVFARLANFLEGHAAISPQIAEAVADLLDGAALPEVPVLGQVSAGEILTLSFLMVPLAERFDLAEKEMLALVSGSPAAAALIADAALAARQRLALATEVFALSIEALGAPLEAYDSALETLWEDDCEAAALRALRAWLAGASARGRRPYQAPVSWRILPRVLGQAERVTQQAEAVAASSLRAVSDNPVYLMPEAAGAQEFPHGRVLSNGGYHNAKAYPALDNLAAAWADLAMLCDRHVTKLLDGRSSLLPDHLSAGEGYIGCLGFTALSYAEQARQAAQRSFLPGSEGGGFSQNDVAVPSFLAWRKEAEAGRCLDACLAILAAVASQAFFVTQKELPARLVPFLEMVRAQVPPLTSARPLGPEVGALSEQVTAMVFAAAEVDKAGRSVSNGA